MIRTATLFIAISISAMLAPHASAETQKALFAGGCFWCMESDFENVDGVIEVTSGYAGGTSDNPNYKTYERGGHVEVVLIEYDDSIVSYDRLLHTFWRSVNPTDPGGQFCDRGYAYSTAIFALDDEQLAAAQASKHELEVKKALDRPIVTPIHGPAKFFPAEDYHQNYYRKNKFRYSFYRKSCGRDAAIKTLWGDEAHAGINKH